ncbi:MAG: hypothetical protein NZ837_05635 [Gammaproteobacteria bacterium]|nr:hypothetical protein [Gammaproteobacteria bacterium]
MSGADQWLTRQLCGAETVFSETTSMVTMPATVAKVISADLAMDIFISNKSALLWSKFRAGNMVCKAKQRKKTSRSEYRILTISILTIITAARRHAGHRPDQCLRC